MSIEDLRVYQAAKTLRAEVEKLRASLKPEFRNLFQHLVDAVDSIINNLAEGNDSIYPNKKRSFFDIAAGSSNEARAALKSLRDEKAFRNQSVYRHIGLCIVIRKMIGEILETLGD